MRRPVLVMVFFVAVFLLYFFTYNYRSDATREWEKYSLSPTELALLKDGDLILRHGYGMVSDGIVQTLNEKYHISHVGILVQCDTCELGFKVIHCVSQSLYPVDGVQDQSLSQFLWDSQKNSIIVVRYKYANDTTRHLISQKAKEYLKRHVPFDHEFNILDSSAFYCSELPWLIFRHVFHVDIFGHIESNSLQHLKFSHFWDPQYFQIVINHQEK